MAYYPPHVVAALATVIAAFFAGGVAFLVAVLSKEQKTSDFRQQWIDALRSDIAELIGEAVLLHDTNDRTMGRGLKKTEEQIEARYSNMVKVRTLVARIELRTNPREHIELLEALRQIQGKEFQADVSSRGAKIDALTAAAQKMLKKEWERVKSGERTFAVTKVVAAAIFVAAALLGSMTVYQNLKTLTYPLPITAPAVPSN